MTYHADITPHAQYYTVHNNQYPTRPEDVKWIVNNSHRFEGLEKEKIYICFENEKPVLESLSTGKAKTIYPKNKKPVRRVVSEKGNFFERRIAICKCGAYKVSIRKMKKPVCNSCLTRVKNEKQVAVYAARKTGEKGVQEKIKKIIPIVKTQAQIAIEALGNYQKVETKEYIPDYFEETWIEKEMECSL